jgi:hypothetical protein
VIGIVIHVACFLAAALIGRWWLLILPVAIWPLVAALEDVEPYALAASVGTAIGLGAVGAGLLVNVLRTRASSS